MKKICITGASGFIGKSLCKALNSKNLSIRGFVRDLNSTDNLDNVEYIKYEDINSNNHWEENFKDCDCIVHCAGKADSMNNEKNINVYYSVNAESTKLLAEKAVKMGVKRLIFLSTVKIYEESVFQSEDKQNFFNKKKTNPKDLYAISKLAAEKFLQEISNKTNLETVILRIPLVYGYGVKGNLRNLMKLLRIGIPLPLGSVKNKRSLIGIDNLIDIIELCIYHPEAKNKTFLVSDNNDLSTPELLKYIGNAMGLKVRLFAFPILILKLFGSMIGMSGAVNRLTKSLQVDIEDTKKILNWQPPISVEESIRRMVKEK